MLVQLDPVKSKQIIIVGKEILKKPSQGMQETEADII